MDSTALVLLSVLSLFDVTNAGELEKHSGIISHNKKFALLLHRYRILFSLKPNWDLFL